LGQWQRFIPLCFVSVTCSKNKIQESLRSQQAF
jgi:hypothetical protein